MSTIAQPAVAAAPAPPTGPRRGGRRGGAGGRGGKANHAYAATNAAAAAAQPDDTEEVRKLRAKYADKLSLLRELFPDWTDEDLLFALQEAGGEVELTVGRISEGHAEQFSSVKSKKQVKKEVGSATTPSSFQGTAAPPISSAGGANASRGGRGGNAAVRGGRGGATRGARGAGRGGIRGGASGRGGASVPAEGVQRGAGAPSGGTTWADTVAATSKTNGAAGGDWGDDVEGLDLKTSSNAAVPAHTEITEGDSAAKASQNAPAASTDKEKAATEEPGIVATTLAKIIPSSLVPKGSKMSWAQIARSNEAAKAPVSEPKPAEKVHPAKAAIIDHGSQAEVEAPTVAPVSAPADGSVSSSVPTSVPAQEASLTREEEDVNEVPASNIPPGFGGMSANEDAKVASATKPGLGRSAQSQRAVQRAKQQEAVVLANNNAPYDNLGVRFGSLNFLGGDDNDAQTEEVTAETVASPHAGTYAEQFAQSAAAPTHVQQNTQTVPTHQDAFTQATSSPYSGKQESVPAQQQQQGYQQGMTQHQEAHQAAVAQAQQAHQQLQQQQQQPVSSQQTEPHTISHQQYQQGNAANPSAAYGGGAALGQTGAQQQSALASQYSDYYASLDAQRLSNFYGNYDQQAAAPRGVNDDRSGVANQAAPQQGLSGTEQTSGVQANSLIHQQALAQQQQQYPNAMPYYYPHYYLPNQFQHYGQPGAGYGQYAMYGQQPPQQQQQQQQQHSSKPTTPAALQSPYAQNGPADGNGAGGYGNVASGGVHYGQSPAVSSTLAGAGGYNDGGYGRGGGNDYSKLYGNSASPAATNVAAAHHNQQSSNTNTIPGLGGFLGQSTTPSNGSGTATQMKNGPSMGDHAYRQYDNGKMNPSQQQQHHQQSQQMNQGGQAGQQQRHSQQGGATTPQQQQQQQQQQQYYQQYNAYAAHQQPNAPSGNYQNYQYRQYWG